MRDLGREREVGAGDGVGRHERDAAPLARESLGQSDPHEVAVAVVDEHRVAGRLPTLDHDLLRRQAVRRARVGPGDRLARPAVHAVGRPRRARRDDDDVGTVLGDGARVERRPRDEVDVSQLSIWTRRQLTTRAHSPRPGSAGIQRIAPPISSVGVDEMDPPHARFASTIAHSIPAGPAPTTSTSLSAFAAAAKRSGCQPRRYSSPAVAFCVHTSRPPPCLKRDRQMLQPMHSRISSEAALLDLLR